jgi:hypothetical protein
MTTATEYASAASGTSWTNATNANADDAAYATYTIAAKNTTGDVNTLSNFGFDSSIPTGSTINSVALEVEHKVSTTGGIAHLESAVAVGGVAGTFNTDSAEQTTDTARSYTSLARPGGGSWTRNDLLDGTLTVQLRARSGNSATSVVYSWDYARVVVDYTGPVTHVTDGALTGQIGSIAGSAAHLAIHTSSGVLAGPGSTVAGSAARTRQHATTGALTGPGSAAAGTAARTRAHATSGILAGIQAEVVGSAARSSSSVEHSTSGALAGQAGTLTGSASRTAGAVTHETSGGLIGQLGAVAGLGTLVAVPVPVVWGGGVPAAGTWTRIASGVPAWGGGSVPSITWLRTYPTNTEWS